MFNLFNKQKLLLSFEYGLILSEVAKQKKIELTSELVKKVEIMIENEFKKKSPTKLSTEMEVNILAVFETN